MDKPRFMSFGPDSVVYVACMGSNTILALPDRNADGIADTVVVAASTSATCHDVRFHRDTMYTSAEAGVVKRWRSNPDSYVFDMQETIINKSTQPNQTGGNHRTRTLVIDTIHDKLYLNVGSRNNAGREMSPGQERAVIEEYNMDGTGRRVYASGIRNAVGMTLHPRTGRLWANNNGSDEQGNNIPPEWVDIVREDGFYGYPYAYHPNNWMNLDVQGYQSIKPLTAADSANVARMVLPAALVASHCAPMALVFSHDHAATGYTTGAFMAMRGSWNRDPISGTKIVYLDFDDDADTTANKVVDLVTGFLRDSTNADSRWARPVGLLLDAAGSLYISLDDGKESVLKLTPPTIPTSIQESLLHHMTVTPNPASELATLRWSMPASELTIVDITGCTTFEQHLDGTLRQATINLQGWARGVYQVRVEGAGSVVTTPLVVR